MNYETAALADILSKNYSRYVADDADIGLVVRYVGSEDSATVTVASGDLTFKHGDAASEADDNANTMGKVVDLINASANWEARLVDCLRADAAAGYLKNLSEETITPNTETLNLPKDTSAALNLSISLSNTGIQAFLDSLGSPFEGDANYYIKALYGTYVNTYGSGDSKIQVYDIDPVAGTEKKIFEEVAADTTDQGYSNFYLYDGLDALEKGHTLLYRLIGSAACTGWVTASWNMKEY